MKAFRLIGRTFSNVVRRMSRETDTFDKALKDLRKTFYRCHDTIVSQRRVIEKLRRREEKARRKKILHRLKYLGAPPAKTRSLSAKFAEASRRLELCHNLPSYTPKSKNPAFASRKMAYKVAIFSLCKDKTVYPLPGDLTADEIAFRNGLPANGGRPFKLYGNHSDLLAYDASKPDPEPRGKYRGEPEIRVY